MKNTGPNVITVCLSAVLFLGTYRASAEIVEFEAYPDNVCAGTASGGTGVCTFSLDTATGDVTYDIQLAGVTPTEMHIHAPVNECALVQFGAVRIVFPAGTDVQGVFSADPDLQDWMRTEKAYFVVHSGPTSSIEISGLLIRQCPSDCSGNGTCIGGTCFCDPGWSGVDCTIQQPVPTVSFWGLSAMTLMLVGGATIVMRRRISPAAA